MYIELLKKITLPIYIIILNLIFMMFEQLRLDISNYSLIVIFGAFFGFIITMGKEENAIEIKVQSINLDFKDIVDSRIYCDNYNMNRERKIFKISLSPFLLDKNHDILIVNYPYFKEKTKEEKKIKEEKYIYFALDKAYVKKTLKLQFVVMNEKSKRISRYNLYLNVYNHKGQFVFYDSYFEKINKILIQKKSKEISIIKQQEKAKYIQQLAFIFKNSYFYETGIIEKNNKLFNHLYHERKWLLHDDDFGKGKSTLDFAFLEDLGFKPIVITPWEENYDNDFIFLIYSKITSKFKRRFNSLDYPSIIFFLAIFLACVALCFSVLKYSFYILNDLIIEYDLKKYCTYMIYSIIIFFKNEIRFNSLLYLLSSIISYKFTMVILPFAIIYVKGISKICQNYYLEGIKRAIIDNNIVLIVEDIDRLDEKSITDMIRILSSLNSYMYDRTNILGIISFNSKNFKIEKFEHDLNSKIICDIIFKDLILYSSMKKYYYNYINSIKYAIAKCSLHIEYEKDDWDNYVPLNIEFIDVQKKLDKEIWQIIEKIKK